MKTRYRAAVALLSVLAFACSAVPERLGLSGHRWSQQEKVMLRSLWLESLEALPADPSNRYADDPQAVELGHRLFFDTRLSSNGQVSCATCHLPEKEFQDGIPLAVGVGTVPRRTMPIAGTAYSPWLFWDGRKDSQWSQALGPLESPVEHGGTRTQYAHVIAEHYREPYEALFGPLPAISHLPPSAGPVEAEAPRAAWEAMRAEDREAITRVYVNMGKAIAAYQRRLQPGTARFDHYLAAVLAGRMQEMQRLFTAEEAAGLRIFVGRGSCTDCHNGPLLTDNHFHNTGVAAVAGLPEDLGRALGAKQVLEDEFNCLSPYSDAAPEECAELRFMVPEGDGLRRAYKPPSLRGVADRPPYMHAGQHATLREVLEHYNRAPHAPAGHSELKPLRLSERELRQLEAFLRTLSGPIAAPPELLRAPAPVPLTTP